jgi:uncharacterized protein (DUF1697 family)
MSNNIKYVALLRGISPLNPNMHNDKLRDVFQELGFHNVETVISSGNVLFESPSRNIKAIEASVEKALPELLGFTSTTIIRSQDELGSLVKKNPFKGIADTHKSRLNVTFLKNPISIKMRFPYSVKDRAYKLIGNYDGAICSVIDLTSSKTPDLMTWLERQFGKEITTRTWKTVHRILKRMEKGA